MSEGAPEKKGSSENEGGWLSQGERGAIWGIRFTAFLVRTLGRGPVRVVVRGIAAYYALFDRAARESSRDWLQRVHGRPASFGEVYGHVFCFAQVVLDRLLFASGRTEKFVINRTGTVALEEQVATGKGAFLIGSHLGSMEAMRAEGENQTLPVTVIGHFENARMINSVLEGLNPELSSKVVHTGGDPVSLALALKEQIDLGGLVAVTADRVGMNDKFIEVDFFGEKAPFSTGPFLLASVLKCPTYLVFGLYFEPDRYELFCEPFMDRIVLPRGRREEALEEVVSRYAERLESYALRAPNNWFNFFDFWKAPEKSSRTLAREE